MSEFILTPYQCLVLSLLRDILGAILYKKNTPQKRVLIDIATQAITEQEFTGNVRDEVRSRAEWLKEQEKKHGVGYLPL